MFKFPQKENDEKNKNQIDSIIEFSAEEISAKNIAEYLRSGIPIIAVTEPINRSTYNGVWNIQALLGVEQNGLNKTFFIYRKVKNLIYQYMSKTYDQENYYFLNNVYQCRNSTIMDLFFSDFRPAYALYHDDSFVCNSFLYLPTEFTNEEGEKYFQDHPDERSFYVGTKRIITFKYKER